MFVDFVEGFSHHGPTIVFQETAHGVVMACASFLNQWPHH